MKRSLIFAAALMLASPAMSGCAMLGMGDSTLVSAEKGLNAFHDVYHGVGVELRAVATPSIGAPVPFLHGEAAHNARVIYDQAGALLKAADKADDAGNATDVETATASGMALVAQVVAIIHPAPQ